MGKKSGKRKRTKERERKIEKKSGRENWFKAKQTNQNFSHASVNASVNATFRLQPYFSQWFIS